MRRALLPAIYASSVLLGAALLFLVQPMVAKMLLPLLGGSPSVWNTCMVFFQTLLLVGYAYAHLLTQRFHRSGQVAVHAAVVLFPLLLLPVALGEGTRPPVEGSPIGWLLGVLARTVGAPFFVLATTGPLLQRWFASTDHPSAANPYPLYAASNLGSLGALVAYPLLVEPTLELSGALGQSVLWSWAYVLFAVLALASATLLLLFPARPAAREATKTREEPPPTWPNRLLWVFCAFVPSSAMLGVTKYLSTDIAAVPLLWTVPLVLYLATMIVAFLPGVRLPLRGLGYLTPILCAGVAVSFWLYDRPWLALQIPLHLSTLLALGLLGHGRLASSRPHPSRLTEYFLFVAAGGALGGIFNALVAPIVFDEVVEYPIALVLACLLRPEATRKALSWGFVSGLAVLFVAAWFHQQATGSTLYTERTFFGVSKVKHVEGPPFTVIDDQGRPQLVQQIPTNNLYHGATRHGLQALVPELRGVPTSYFHRTGPIGQLFAVFEGTGKTDRVAIVGLGAGILAAYGRAGQQFTFFEIDPAVVRIAGDPRFFTYLADSRARVEVVTGDGRLSLAGSPDESFGVVIIDAFSSDAIPAHLLTREAVSLYLRKLRPDGLVAFHITSQYVDLSPVLDAIARDLGLAGLVRDDEVTSLEQQNEGKDFSTWAVLARNRASLGPLPSDTRWRPLPTADLRSGHGRTLWTDDYSNVLGVLRNW